MQFIAAGVIVVLVVAVSVALYLRLTVQIDRLRADIAEARIEGLLSRGDLAALRPEPPRRRRHLWLVPVAAFASGAVAWVRQHRAETATVGVAVAAAAAVAVVTLTSDDMDGGGARARPTASAPSVGAPPSPARPSPNPSAPAPEPSTSTLRPSDPPQSAADDGTAGPVPQLSEVPGGTPTAPRPTPVPTSPSPRPVPPSDDTPADQDEADDEDSGLICLGLDLSPMLGALCLL